MGKNNIKPKNTGWGKPDVYAYIALTNKAGAEKMLKESGYMHKPNSPKQMADMLAHHVLNDGEKAIIDLASIHPDYDMIVEAYKKKLPTESTPVQSQPTKLFSGQENLNCMGADGTQKPGMSDKTMNALIISGAALLAVTIVAVVALKN